VLDRGAAGWPGGAASRTMSALLHRSGAWLRAAQAALPQDRAIDVESMRSYLDTRLAELETTGPVRLTRAGRSAVERYRDRLMGDLGSESLRPVWIHADFCPENIITGDGEITVLDFLMAKSGTVYHDVAHLFMHLDSMKVKPWFRPAVIDGLQRDLLAGFEPGLEPERPLFALMLLQHVICHLVALQAPAPGRTARLYRAALHRRHRRWLVRVAGLDNASWTR
jgi:Phosphotransferase enzyme family